MEEERRGGINPPVFWTALLIVLCLAIFLIFWPEAGTRAVDTVWTFVTANFGWYFLLFGAFCFVVLMWLAFGRYGNVKLGRAEDKPEFSKFSWIAMLFCAGIGGGIMMWCIMEPVYYMSGPPLGVDVGSFLSFEWANTYGLFHWGFSAWAIYCIPTIPIAYAVFARREPSLRISTSCRAIFGDRVDGWVGVVIDILIMFGLIGAVGTSLGFAVPALSSVLHALFGLEQTMGLQILIIIAWVIVFGTSVYRGLSKGIKVLSDINIYLALALIVFVLLAGPTVYILKMWVNSTGLILDNFFRMSFWLDPVAQGGFPEAWTVFYWAWWIAYAPMMGLFVARISKGRTIRELVIAECVWGTLGCWVYFAIFGAYTVYLESNQIVSLQEALASGGEFGAIATVLATLPFPKIAMAVWALCIFIFLATTLDSTSYTLASVCTKVLHGDEEPVLWNRVIWALTLGAISIGLLMVGGLQPAQLSSLVAALPLTLVLGVLIFSGIKMLKEDFPHLSSKPLSIDEKPPEVAHQQQYVIDAEDGVTL
jgi:BCCT family betaine/carnitine transporter